MTFDQRIWKTGVMAVVVTLVFGFVVFRAEEWSRGFNGEFLVYGLTDGTGGTGGTITKVIPQIAVGSFDGNLTRYSTFIQVVNTGTAAATVSGSFFKDDGTAAITQFRTVVGTTTTDLTGSFSNVTVPANGVLVVSFEPGTGVSPAILWGRLTSTGAVTVATTFELRDAATNVLYGRVGVSASDSDMRTFVIPRIRNTTTGYDVGFAIVNTGTSTVSLTGTLRDSNGVATATKVQTLRPGQKVVGFSREFFAPTAEPTGTTYGFMVFESSSSSFAAVSLGIEGGNITSLPVDRLQ